MVMIDAKTFSWGKDAYGIPKGVAERSDLYGIWPENKMPANFYVKSEKTGSIKAFGYCSSALDIEGEAYADIFTADNGLFQIWIYND